MASNNGNVLVLNIFESWRHFSFLILIQTFSSDGSGFYYFSYT